MKTRSLVPLAVAVAALAPATADAAVKTGTYNGQPLSAGGDQTSFGITVDGGKVTGLVIQWACGGSDTVDRRTIVVAHADDKNVFPVKKNAFSWSGKAQTNYGDIFSDTFQFKEGKATVKVTGKWKGSTVSGTFKASMSGCTSGPLTYTAKRA